MYKASPFIVLLSKIPIIFEVPTSMERKK